VYLKSSIVTSLILCVVLSIPSLVMAQGIAISTQAGWFGQAAADREMKEIANNVKGIDIKTYTPDKQADLATWVKSRTGDKKVDVLILCGQFPNTIYKPGNTQKDDSLAELFLDDGNIILNTGDYMFYVVDGAGTNAAGGLQTMMDIAAITMWDDNTAVKVTAKGKATCPTLKDFQTDRPFHLNELGTDWEAEIILAQNDAGTRADPAIVKNKKTGGRLGIFYQTAGQDDDPRGEAISEFLNNWYKTIVVAVEPTDKVASTWANIKSR